MGEPRGGGPAGSEGEEERRGAKTPHGRQGWGEKKEKKRKRPGAPRRRHRRPSPASPKAPSPAERGATSSLGRTRSFARKPRARSVRRAPPPRTCARGGGRGTPEAAGGLGAGRLRGPAAPLFLFDLRGRSPVVIVCGPAWGPARESRASPHGGAAVIPALLAPSPPRPQLSRHRPAWATSRWEGGGGTRDRKPLLGSGNCCGSPPAPAGQSPNGLSFCQCPVPWCRPLRTSWWTAFHLPRGGDKRDFAYSQQRGIERNPGLTGELSRKGRNALFGEDVC